MPANQTSGNPNANPHGSGDPPKTDTERGVSPAPPPRDTSDESKPSVPPEKANE